MSDDASDRGTDDFRDEDSRDEGADSEQQDSGGEGEQQPEERSREERQEDEEAPEGETLRPISVRDLMPSPPSRPSRRPPDRAERPERPGPEAEEAVEEVALPGGEAEEAREGEEVREEAAEEVEAPEADAAEAPETAAAASVPTPVRVAMDAPPPGDSRPAEDLPSRRFEVDGQEWIVRISGRTITGTRPDAGALLMHLSFFRVEDPERPSRRLITVDRPLDALYQEDLHELLGRSRPVDAGGVGVVE